MELKWRTSRSNSRNATSSFTFDGTTYHLTIFVTPNETYRISIKSNEEMPQYYNNDFDTFTEAEKVCEELIKQLEEEVGARPKEQIYDGSGYGDNAYYGEIDYE